MHGTPESRRPQNDLIILCNIFYCFPARRREGFLCVKVQNTNERSRRTLTLLLFLLRPPSVSSDTVCARENADTPLSHLWRVWMKRAERLKRSRPCVLIWTFLLSPCGDNGDGNTEVVVATMTSAYCAVNEPTQLHVRQESNTLGTRPMHGRSGSV